MTERSEGMNLKADRPEGVRSHAGLAGAVDTENTMAELILTEAEKAAALWSDLDDAALGRLVKKKMAALTTAAEQLDRATMYAAALLICCGAAECNASEAKFDLDGVTQTGREFGDWTVIATKKPANKEFEDKAVGYQARLDAGDYAKPATAEQIDKARREIARNLLAVQVIRGQRKASWWIDTRASSVEAMLYDLRTEIDQAVAAQRAEPSSSHEMAAKQGAETEALLKPVGAPKSAQIAEISHVGEYLRVIFQERIEAFRLLMRAAGFEWANGRWERKLTWMQGDPIDRMAELAHRLLAAGFLVRIHDVDARARAVSGNFTPEQRRWISVPTEGKFAGWLMIRWPREDDLYGPAKRLLGARYQNGAVYVPPGSVEEAADFAAAYGFSLSPAAQRQMEQHRAAMAAGAVIADPKRGPEPLRVPVSGVPDKLDAAVGEIDPDLREDV